MTIRRVLTTTNLSALNLHQRVLLHDAFLATAIDGAFDEGVAIDGDVGTGSQGQRLDILQISCFLCTSGIILLRITRRHTPGILISSIPLVGQHTLAATEDVAEEVGHRHRFVGTNHGIALDGDEALAGFRVCQ